MPSPSPPRPPPRVLPVARWPPGPQHTPTHIRGRLIAGHATSPELEPACSIASLSTQLHRYTHPRAWHTAAPTRSPYPARPMPQFPYYRTHRNLARHGRGRLVGAYRVSFYTIPSRLTAQCRHDSPQRRPTWALLAATATEWAAPRATRAGRGRRLAAAAAAPLRSWARGCGVPPPALHPAPWRRWCGGSPCAPPARRPAGLGDKVPVRMYGVRHATGTWS